MTPALFLALAAGSVVVGAIIGAADLSLWWYLLWVFAGLLIGNKFARKT